MASVKPNLISVVMPCFNAEQYIESSVDSVLGQTYAAVELIVVDDGSVDGSRSILETLCRKDGRVRLIFQENKGPGPARNAGLRAAIGEFIAFLDSDDWWSPQCLEKLHAALLRDNASIAYCGWQNVGLPGGMSDPYIPPEYGPNDKIGYFLWDCPWPIHAALSRREAIFEVGGYNEKWSSCMDYDLWLRAGSRSTLVRVPEVLAFYRHHSGDQITKNILRSARNSYLLKKEFLENNPDVVRILGNRTIRRLVLGRFLETGFKSYWKGDMTTARAIFREVMRNRYGALSEWKYMLPSLLPLRFHSWLIKVRHMRKNSS